MKKYIGKLAKVLLVSALCPLMQSCFSLDEEWYSEVTPDTFFKTKENIYSIANRPFTHGFWYEGIDRWYLQEYTADQMIQPQRGNDWFDGGIFFRLQYHTWTPDDAHIWQTWRGTGMGISLAMECKKDLEGLNYEEFGLTEADKQDHLNQMNAMMGYFYLRALDYFGFTAREKQRIHASLQDPFPLRIVTGLISDGLNDALGLSPDDPKRFTPGAVSYMAPELVERMRKLLSYDTRVADSARTKGALTKDEEKTLRTKVKTLLQSYAVKEPGKLWGFNDVSLPEFMYRGLGENGNLDAEFFYDKFTSLAMSDEQLRAVERAEQEYRLSVNPRKPNETDAEVTSTRRSPSTAQTTQAQRRSGRVRDPESGLYYKRSVLDKEEKRRKERRETLDKHFNPSLSETYGIGKR
jgi:hypothetical protein